METFQDYLMKVQKYSFCYIIIGFTVTLIPPCLIKALKAFILTGRRLLNSSLNQKKITHCILFGRSHAFSKDYTSLMMSVVGSVCIRHQCHVNARNSLSHACRSHSSCMRGRRNLNLRGLCLSGMALKDNY